MSSSASENVASKYRKDMLLGEGTWGHVYLAKRQEDNLKVAIKRIKPRDAHMGLNFTALREIRFLKAIKSVNILEVLM